MPAIATLADNFDDNTINGTLWLGNFGTVSETGGRARIACTTDYAAFVSAASYSLAGSSVYARVYPPAAGGAATTAYAQMVVLSSTDGTEAGFQINAVGGQLRCMANVDYWDDTATVLTYDPTAHAWLRLREAAGSMQWDTSPDGTTWTTRRTLTTPAWVTAGTTLRLSMEAHRDSGTADFAEFDNVDTPPTVASSYAKQAAFLAFF
jgi:hypothetical protein